MIRWRPVSEFDPERMFGVDWLWWNGERALIGSVMFDGTLNFAGAADLSELELFAPIIGPNGYVDQLPSPERVEQERQSWARSQAMMAMRSGPVHDITGDVYRVAPRALHEWQKASK